MEVTTVKYHCFDSAYCEWYKCNNCECTYIMEEYNYCPECGRKIIKDCKK